MQEYAESAVSKHMRLYAEIAEHAGSNIKTGTVWKGYENVIENAAAQTK
jgi:penicillin-binding protein 1A